MIKLISWNINGIRAAIKKGLWDKVKDISPDLISFQETKAGEDIMNKPLVDSENWDKVFHSATMKKGYSGVATYYPTSDNQNMFDLALGSSSHKLTTELVQIGLGLPKFDEEGRLVITKHTIENPKTEIKDFVIINGYYPQGGRGPHRVEYKIEFYKEVHKLANKLRKKGENVLLCGDLNTTVADIDLARPKQNKNNTGCLLEEREALDWFLNDGFIDTFRHFYPDKPDMYSYWDQITRARERNVGWRIDYWLADEKILPYIKDSFILTEVMGSDHAPVGINLDL